MNRFGVYPKLTKKYILDRISQEEIMGKFLGIVVSNETLKSNSIRSPYRTDNNPSCNYYYNENGKLRFRDHTTGLNYDCFDVVARNISVSVYSKQGFVFVLNEIAKSFRIHKYVDYEEVKKYEIIKSNYHKTIKNKKKVIIQYKVVLKKANYHDKAYWNRGGLELEDLKGVYFIKKLYISYNNNRFKIIYNYNPKDPCYGYYGGKDVIKNIDLWKFYFPLRNKGEKLNPRFLSNGRFIQGFNYLVPDRILVLTKSFKDVKVFNKIGIQSCAISTETTEPTKEEAFLLSKYFDFIITCFDSDRTGIIMSNTLRKKYNFKPIMFTTGRFNTIDFKAKDAFEYVEHNGLDSLRTLINTIYSTYSEEMNSFIDSIENKLKTQNETIYR